MLLDGTASQLMRSVLNVCEWNPMPVHQGASASHLSSPRYLFVGIFQQFPEGDSGGRNLLLNAGEGGAHRLRAVPVSPGTPTQGLLRRTGWAVT
jgi:hypothetical protein